MLHEREQELSTIRDEASAARQQVDQLNKQLLDDRAQLLEEAQRDREQILEEAQRDREQLLEEARRDCAQVQDEAHKDRMEVMDEAQRTIEKANRKLMHHGMLMEEARLLRGSCAAYRRAEEQHLGQVQRLTDDLKDARKEISELDASVVSRKCPSCCRDLPPDVFFPLEGCGHRRHCVPCIRNYSKARLDMCKAPECPLGALCKRPAILESDLIKLDGLGCQGLMGPLDDEAGEPPLDLAARTINQRRVASAGESAFVCSHRGCQALVDVGWTGSSSSSSHQHDHQHRNTVCQKCTAVHCVLCRVVNPVGECDFIAEQNRVVEAMISQADGETKLCPNCVTPISKDGGCNSVQCIGCDHFFCWLCGTVTATSNDEAGTHRSAVSHMHFKLPELDGYPVLELVEDAALRARLHARVLKGHTTGCIDKMFLVDPGPEVDTYRHPPADHVRRVLFPDGGGRSGGSSSSIIVID